MPCEPPHLLGAGRLPYKKPRKQAFVVFNHDQTICAHKVRRDRNRIYARNSRERKKRYIREMERKNQLLEIENRILRDMLLKRHVPEAKDMLKHTVREDSVLDASRQLSAFIPYVPQVDGLDMNTGGLTTDGLQQVPWANPVEESLFNVDEFPIPIDGHGYSPSPTSSHSDT